MLLIKSKAKKVFGAIGLCLLLLVSIPVAVAVAACDPGVQTCSSQWQITESIFGTGGELNACSDEYCSQQTAGELAVGKVCSTNQYCAQAGFNTFRQPFLEFEILTPSVNVGVLEADETHVGTAQFSVKTYLAHGYAVTTASDPPASGTNTLDPMATPSVSALGTEQFGINLVANSCPANLPPPTDPGYCSGGFGALPAQVPDATFGFGEPAADYATADTFKYQKGNTIALSNSSSGVTQFTISYLFNISEVTPAGTYTMQHDLVVTSTF